MTAIRAWYREPLVWLIISLQLSAAKDQPLPDRLDLRWLHATRAGFDRTQMLIRSPDGSYRGVSPELAPGHWYVQVEAQDWRLQGSLRIPGEVRLLLVPSPIPPPPAAIHPLPRATTHA